MSNKTPKLNEEDGDFVLQLKSIRASDERQIYYAANFTVVESDNPKVRVGSEVGWYTERNSKFPQYFFDEVRLFLGALGHQKADEVTETESEASKQPDFMGLGSNIRARVRRGKPSKKDGKQYGEVSFSEF